MNATKTTTITVEIKGQKIEMTEAEARELALSLNGLLGIPEMIRQPWPTPTWPGAPYRPTPIPQWPSIAPNTSDSTAPENFADVTMRN